MKQQCLRKLPLTEYVAMVYGQDIYRQQGLILNYNILRTFCNNAKKYFELEPWHICEILRGLTENPEGMYIQAAHWFFSDQKPFPSEDILQTLTRISIWPLHEPVLSSYGDRKEALRKRLDDNDKWNSRDIQGKLKSPIPIPFIQFHL